MKQDPRFFLCKSCNTLAELIQDGGAPLACCGSPMVELKANTSEGAAEKHLPALERSGNEIVAKVGSVFHPMTEEHSIQWAYLQTEKGGQRRDFTPSDEPIARFAVPADDAPVAVYSYCNLHGFWKTEC